MICKNCIHFKVCKHKSKSVYECEHFDDRHIPKEIIIQKFPDNPEVDRVPMDIKLHYCPCCNVRFIGWGMKYCGECGQALDWSDTE